MQWIYEAIAKYTGVTDPVEVNEIYDWMAEVVYTFNGLSPERFRCEAIEAKAANDFAKTDAGRVHLEALEREFNAA